MNPTEDSGSRPASEFDEESLLLDASFPSGDRTHLSVKIEESGIVVSGCDSGPVLKEFHGDTDWEFQIVVAPEHAQRLAKALLKLAFQSPREPWRCAGDLRKFLKDEGIPANFSAY